MFDINAFTSTLYNSAINGRLIEKQWGTLWRIASIEISGKDFVENFTAIYDYWVEHCPMHFGRFKEFNTWRVSQSGLLVNCTGFSISDISEDSNYHICVTTYDNGEKGIYQVFVIPSNDKQLNTWLNQPFYNHSENYYSQYVDAVDKWEQENLSEEERTNSQEAYEEDEDKDFYSSYYDYVECCGYPNGEYYKTYEDWLIEDFFKIA